MTLDGTAFALMVATGEACIVPFAVALGIGEAWAGWLGTMPLMAGALMQMVTPWGVVWLRRARHRDDSRGFICDADIRRRS
jgi:hypothetical protein